MIDLNYSYCQFLRSSVTSHSLFKYVELKEYEEVLRLMLLSKDPGKESEFPVGTFLLTKGDDNIIKLLSNLRKIETDNELSFVFLISVCP